MLAKKTFFFLIFTLRLICLQCERDFSVELEKRTPRRLTALKIGRIIQKQSCLLVKLFSRDYN